MNKELEALESLFDLVTCQGSFEKAQKYFNIIEQALQRLESIDNSKPSEALECLEKITDTFGCDMAYYHSNSIDIIKQALLKAQGQEKKFQELTDVLINMVTEYRLYPYKTGDKKDPRYYLMKNENECVVPVEIPKWLYDFISKGGN